MWTGPSEVNGIVALARAAPPAFLLLALSFDMPPRRSGPGAAAKARKGPKKIVQAVQKKVKTEQRHQQKKEERVNPSFQRAMNCFFERTIQEDRSYVFEMLAQNDAWMPRLAALFRSGAMKQLLTEGMSSLDSFTMSGDEVPRWKGKCYKVLSLPYNAKLHMVKPWIVDVIPDAEAADGHVNGNWLDQVLKFLFHVDEKTPLPKHSDIRSLDVLKKFAEARVNDIGNRLSNKRLIYGEQEELKFYQLGADKRTLTCCFLAGEDNVASLPELRGNAEWRLTNAFDAGCVAVCIPGRSHCLQLRFLLQQGQGPLDRQVGLRDQGGARGCA